jgi:hypothetical protein
VVCGLLSFCLVFPAVPGFAFGLAAARMARHDLGVMRAGLMDPNGRKQTDAALDRAVVGMALCVGAGLVGGGALGVLLRAA